AAAAEPGGPEPATAVRDRAADPLHERPAADGVVRESGMGAGSLVDYGVDHHRAQHAPGEADDRGVDRERGPVASAGAGGDDSGGGGAARTAGVGRAGPRVR